MKAFDKSVEEYRTIYRAAQDDHVRMTGLRGTMEEMEAILIDRINKKRGRLVTREQILDEYK